MWSSRISTQSSHQNLNTFPDFGGWVAASAAPVSLDVVCDSSTSSALNENPVVVSSESWSTSTLKRKNNVEN